jgi:hypothetical protein
MPRETYNSGEILTDDLGRLWWIQGTNPERGLLMPQLPEYLAMVPEEETTINVPGWEFFRAPPDYVLAEREACIRDIESIYVEGDHLTGTWMCKAVDKIRSRK